MSNIGSSSTKVIHRFSLLVLILAAGCGQEVPTANDMADSSTADMTPQAELGAGANRPVNASPSLGMLVSAKKLQQPSNSDGVRILDARSQAEFDAGHIPAAVPIDVTAWKALTLKDAGAGLHDQSAWSKAVGDLGIEGETSVVVYSSSPTSAARIWWILKYVGVKDAGILDGGWDAWRAADGEVSTDKVDVQPADFSAKFQDDRLASIGDLKGTHASTDLIIVDARSLGEFQGKGDGKGRIPGATHLEWNELLTADGRYKSIDELKRLFEQHGITPEKTAVTHCQTGGRASVNVFALELAGFGKVKNYYCGWSEWGPDAEAPREQGEPQP